MTHPGKKNTVQILWLPFYNKSNESRSGKESEYEIKKICNEYQTDTILIGVPYNMDGTLGFQAKNCLKFIEPLRNDYVIL